ncbi:NADP-dependent oxidoreductase domain-containing protein [Daedaleopsis nitida]|nr:NADP-dependent oxidoreductase domain-containing protein [Daedaleopsis nitida]
MSQQPLAEYRQLGRSGLRVSVPIFGGMTVGNTQWSPWVLSVQQALPLLKAAWDLGINTVDTANTYSNGDSEKVLGTFMQQYNIPREKIVIMTKVFFLVSEDPSELTMLNPGLNNTRDHVNQGGASRAALFNQVDASLQRLQTSYIDLLQLHTFDPTTPIEETMKALHDLVQIGKVRYIGACNMRTWQFAEMNRIAEVNGWTQFVSMQTEYSLLYRPDEREMLDYCKYKGIGVVAYSPLMDGHLARPVGTETSRTKSIAGTPFEKPRRDSDKKIIQRVEELAKKKNWKMSQVALAWVASKVTSPIVGANTAARIQESIVTGKTLEAEDVKYLEELYEMQGHRF